MLISLPPGSLDTPGVIPIPSSGAEAVACSYTHADDREPRPMVGALVVRRSRGDEVEVKLDLVQADGEQGYHALEFASVERFERVERWSR